MELSEGKRRMREFLSDHPDCTIVTTGTGRSNHMLSVDVSFRDGKDVHFLLQLTSYGPPTDNQTLSITSEEELAGEPPSRRAYPDFSGESVDSDEGTRFSERDFCENLDRLINQQSPPATPEQDSLIELEKQTTTMFKPTDSYEPTVEIDESLYESICAELGSYGASWYFTENGTVKYFQDGEWDRADRSTIESMVQSSSESKTKSTGMGM